MTEETMQRMKLEVDQLNKISTEQGRTILLLLSVVRLLARQLPQDSLHQKFQKEIQDIPFDPRVSKYDQDMAKTKAIELVSVYFP